MESDMDEFLNSDMLIGIAVFVAGLAVTGLLFGVGKLVKSIKDSDNKWDDKFLPALEAIQKSLEDLKK